VEDEIKEADIAVVNLEVTLPGKQFSGYPNFGSPDEFAFALKDAGFDVFLTANNHILDKGHNGLERTIRVLDSMKVKHTGVFANKEKRELYYPLMMIKNGVRIAMLNYTYGTNEGHVPAPPDVVNYIDRKQILKDIDAAGQMKADVIIANMHWGAEYILKHNKEQKELADFLVKNGVRLVIGAHPHVVQPIDIQRDSTGIKSVVVYSTGNLISNMKLTDTRGGMMVKIGISKDEDNNVRIDSCDYSLVWVHKLMKDKDTPVFFQLWPVSKINNEEGRKMIGEKDWERLQIFKTNAKNAAESLWKKD
jgi:poly-gamma-glutamate synthesis protein (capsule biosynthesis protein)